MKRRKIKKKGIKFVIHLSICCGFLFFILGLYFAARQYIEQKFIVCDRNFALISHIDSAKIESNKLILSGWIFQINQNSIDTNIELIIYDEKKVKGYISRIIKKDSREVNEYFQCEYDYSKAGFEAQISSRRLNLQNMSYEILFRLKNTNRAYRSGYYLVDGELIYKPAIDSKPVIGEGETLKQIVENGILLGCNQEYGVHIYQYNQNLYWVVDKTYPFVENTYIFLHLYTTQKKQLPEESEKYGFLNLDFVFNDYEITSIDECDYRVATRTLPNEYAITFLRTGDYNLKTGDILWEMNLDYLQNEFSIMNGW